MLGITARAWRRCARWRASRRGAAGAFPCFDRGRAPGRSGDYPSAGSGTTLQPDYAALPLGQIVPRLADEGVYLASESTFYRVLRVHDLQHSVLSLSKHHRGRAKAPSTPRPPTTHCADKPNQVWCWDITRLPGPIRGQFYFLYLIIDLYSRKIACLRQAGVKASWTHHGCCMVITAARSRGRPSRPY